MTSLTRIDEIWQLDLGDGDTRFNVETVAELNEAIDEIESGDAPAALVTTASGKIWHNGLDLDAMAKMDDPMGFVDTVEAVFGRLLRLPVPTIAAIQGHTFAGGAMFALSHDMRVMREDRGWFCLPEVDLGMNFRPGMAALIAAKLPQPALHRAAALGERFTGPTAVELGIADAVAPDGGVAAAARTLATGLAAKATPVLAEIRATYYPEAIEALGTRRTL